MSDVFSVIFMNFFGYDAIIFAVAVVTAFIFIQTKKSAERLHKKMNLTVYVPDGDYSQLEVSTEIAELRESEVLNMNRNASRLYSLFVNLTGIFPLLGILGTVTSLLGLVADMSDVTGNFYGALTSTFWGLVFAIIFKFLDGVIAPSMEANEKSVNMFIERLHSAERQAL